MCSSPITLKIYKQRSFIDLSVDQRQLFKMNVLKKLNSFGGFEKPYHGLPKLKLGYHEILSFRESTGRYGRGIIAELEDEIIFLPQYMVEKIDSEDVRELNDSPEKMYLYFNGRHQTKK